MRGYYVRSRGRVMGPFKLDELRALRANRQIQGYDEISRDQVTWVAADLSDLFGPPAPPPAPPRPAGTAPPPPAPVRLPGPPLLTPVRLIVAGAVAAILLLVGVGIFLAKGGKGYTGAAAGDAGNSAVTTVGRGAIRFEGGTTTADRDKVLTDAVGLVVAGLTVTRPDGKQYDRNLGTGSGFVVTKDGHMLTNRHVVQDVVEMRRSPQRVDTEAKLKMRIEPTLWVFFGKDQKHVAELLHVSENYDLAVLKVARACPRHFALCDREAAQIPLLDAVSTLGFPGMDRTPWTVKDFMDQGVREKAMGPIQTAFPDAAFDLSKRDGSVTKKAMRNRFDAAEKECMMLQHSAQVFPGNSGGPLVTRAGLVIGINTWNLPQEIKDGAGKTVAVGGRTNINFALTLPQLKAEIDAHAPGVVWESLPD